MSLNDVLDRIDTELDAATQRLLELLRIQSISTDPAYKAECDKAADWLVADLNSIGIKAENAKPLATPWSWVISGKRTPTPPMYSFMVTMTYSPSIRLTCGRRLLLSRNWKRPKMAP